MATSIERVVVLGAGTMGAAIAGHCANAGLPVYLLDIAPTSLTTDEEARGLSLTDARVRNHIVTAGYDRMVKARPANLFSAATAGLITTGNFEDNFDWVSEGDWILEAIIERLDVKRALMSRIETVRKPASIVSSNTSGIPLGQIAADLGESFRQHFLGTHFFNPPRYLKLLEIIPTADTDAGVVARMRHFGEKVLGKGTVICKDTPNFIGNRIGTFSGMYTAQFAIDQGYTVEEVDALTGPLIGRPKTATYRLSDLAGLDIMVGVADNLYQAVPDDESREQFKTPELMRRMVQEGKLGNKTNAGFYKRVDLPGGRRDFQALDLTTFEYRSAAEPSIPLLEEANKLRELGERLRFILRRADDGDRYALLVDEAIVPTLGYAARRVPEISDSIVAVDDAMRWGFAHELGPFETWDALGVADTVARMERRDIGVPAWVNAMLSAGNHSFYRDGPQGREAYSPLSQRYEAVARDPGNIDLAALKRAGKEVIALKGASLVDLGDGVLGLEFHSKANAIGEDAFELLDRGLSLLATDDPWQAMVIGNQGAFFSAGVDLAQVGAAVHAGQYERIEQLLERVHGLVQRVRFSAKPVVAAPFGQTLGLGAELALAAAGICAEGETYFGLVEVGVGLIPGGGGCKELVRRIVSPSLKVAGTDPAPFLRHAFELVGQARVSGSAVEAREWGYLGPSDRIVLGREQHLAAAKRMALDLAEAGYRAPARGNTCYAAGQGLYATLAIGIHQFLVGSYISEYDARVGRALARVLCGGDISAPQWVDEEYFLRLERAEFLSLLREPKTQERIAHMLQRGKPLRN